MAKKTYFSYFGNVVIWDVELRDIWSHFLINEVYKDNQNVFKNYYVKDGENPEELSYRFYNDKKYDWILLLSNDIKDYFYDWPLTDNEVRDLAQRYFDSGDYDFDTGETVDSIFTDLQEENDAKRDIQYLDPALLPDFLYEMEKKAT